MRAEFGALQYRCSKGGIRQEQDRTAVSRALKEIRSVNVNAIVWFVQELQWDGCDRNGLK